MLLQATNAVKAKFINLWVTFEAVRRHGPIPRIRVAHMTGLSKQATSDLVDELLADGFLRQEKNPAERQVGKPPIPLSINPDGAFSIGFHIDQGRIVAVTQNLAGAVLQRESWPFDDPDPEMVARSLAEAAGRLLAAAPQDRERFLGIGLATPGPFGRSVISPPHLPDWDGGLLLAQLRQLTGLPVVLANEGQCAITAESRFGTIANALTDLVYVSLGKGLGSAAMIHGKVFGGAYGNAGEFGHTIVVPDGHPCICGKRGCLETYVSLNALRRFLAERGVDVPSFQALEADFSAGHPLVAAWIEQGLEPLRSGLSTLENFFDPETVMFGGDAPGWLTNAFVERVQPLYPSLRSVEREWPRLMRAELGADAMVRGAAVLPVLARFHPQHQNAGTVTEAIPGLFSKLA